jgi:hypothetical protein
MPAAAARLVIAISFAAFVLTVAAVLMHAIAPAMP